MCDKCFPPDFPKELIKRYNKREWDFTMDGEVQGKIKHLRFYWHEGDGKDEYWKGVERLRFNGDGRTEYRFCYWANRGKGWYWGESCPFYQVEILDRVLEGLKSIRRLTPEKP